MKPRRLYLKQDHTLLPTVIQQIYQLQQLSAGINEIHGLGERAISVMETLQKQKKLPQLPTHGKSVIRHLLLIDRAVDFSSLFVTPLSYEGLIDQVLLLISYDCSSFIFMQVELKFQQQ